MYHKVHCPKCGNVMYANELAFDFGKLINKALEKAKNRKFGSSDEWYILTQVNLCLYLTLEDLKQDYNFIKMSDGRYSGTFLFDSKKLADQLVRLTKRVNTNIQILANSQGVEYDRLTRFMALNKGEDAEELAEKIQQIASMCVRNPNGLIVQFDVEVSMEEDDQGNYFANSLMVTYDDDDQEKVSQFVCQGHKRIPCGNPLYGHAGRYKEVIIGLAGTARVGKTAYLAALLASIMRKSDGETKLGFEQSVLVNIAYKGEDFDRFQNDILEPYVIGQKIQKTEEKGESIPLFSLTFKINGKRNFIFTFIDMPGEVYDKKDSDEGASFVLNSREIIRHASMIWLCITPSQIKGEEMVATSDRVNMKFEEALTNIDKTMKAINVNGKIPTAVLITRSDEADEKSHIFYPNFNPFSKEKANGEIIEDKDERLWWVSKDGYLYYDHMKWFIQRSYRFLNTNPSLPVSIENVFGKFTPFAVAAYGFSIDNPYASNINETRLPTPSMIEGPFLWTLATLGIIPCFYEKTVIKETKGFLGLGKKEEEVTELVRVSGDDVNILFYYPYSIE